MARQTYGNTRARLAILQHVERKYRLPRGTMWGVYGAETDFGRNLSTSSVGAQGPFQFMSGTAASMGVDPWNFAQAADGAARYIAQNYRGDLSVALASYNAGPGAVAKYGGVPPYAETQAYVKKIPALMRTAPYGPAGEPAPRGRGAAVVAQPGTRTVRTPATTTVDRRAAFIDSLLSSDPAQAASGRLSMNGGILQAAQQRIASGAYTTSAPSTTRVVTQRAAAASGRSVKPHGTVHPDGTIVVAPGANRAGGHLTKTTGDVVRRIAASYGRPLTIGTATNHNQYTTTGNVSDHWDGHGADIPMMGADLTRLGDSAMRAFGQKPTGGGAHTFYWNGLRIQVIYNSNVGGNHYNHLHVGARPA